MPCSQRANHARLDIVERSASESVLLSIHSARAVAAVLDELSKRPRAGYLLHWFLGDREEIETAARLGCYFSVSAAMDDWRLAAFPPERVLRETDFPAGGRRAGAQPGDTLLLERRLASLWTVPPEEIRALLYRNLRHVAVESSAVERLSERTRDLLLVA